MSPPTFDLQSDFGNKARSRGQPLVYIGFRSRSASQPRVIR